MKVFSFIWVFIIPSICMAQVNVDKPVILTGAIEADRQILNVGNPTEGSDGVSVHAYRNGVVSHGVATGGNIVTVDLEPNAETYSNGLMLTFIAPSTNSDTAYIDVDGLGPVIVIRPDGLPLDPSDIRTGQAVVVTYLNGQFITQGRYTETCPVGSVKVNETYCIQVNESGPLNWFDAAVHCHEQGGRLCKWDEHFYACEQVDLNLQDMHNNWEWIDDTSDHTHTADQVNRWQCKSQRSIGATLVELGAYRCCFSIR